MNNQHKAKKYNLLKVVNIINEYAKKRIKYSFLAFGVVFYSLNLTSQISGCKTVVIDAGHGGKDAGCSGKKSKEKTIALGIALELGKKIKANYKDVKVIYTRKTDKFVELDERAKIANKNNADLFICIHANSAKSSRVRGADTHVLGLHKTKEQKEIAKRENAVIELEANPGKYANITPDKLIARTMQLSVYLNQSIIFASNIQKEFKKLGRVDRGVKQAGFVVLYKTTMPSVLIESGFLTNTKEEAFLLKKANQRKMAGAIFNAFKIYKKERDKVAKALKGEGAVKVKTKQNNKVIFKIQLASSRKKIEEKAYNFKGLPNVKRKKVGKYYRYFYGQTESYKKIKESMHTVKRKGYKDAFILAFFNGNRISLKKAIKLADN